MKNFLSVSLSIISFIMIFTLNVFAVDCNGTFDNEVVISETTEYFEDGSSITTTITQFANERQTRETKSISGSKTHTAKDADGNVLFKFKISATFNVNVGVSATCTTVSCSASDCNYGWELDSSATSKTSNTAHATGIFKKKTLFITTQTREIITSLSCNANGTLS